MPQVTNTNLAGATLVLTTSTDTLTNKTLTAPIIATISNTGVLTLPTSTDTLVGRATTDTLTNKTLTAPVIATITNGAATLTLPTSTDTLVGRATTDTLTNKTLTSPAITSPTITAATINGAVGGSGVYSSSAQPRCSAYNSATQSIADSTQVLLTLDSEDFDVTSMHSTSSNTSRVTVPTGGDGLYLITGSALAAANATGQVQLRLVKNGTVVFINSLKNNATIGQMLMVQYLAVLAATDYMELAAYQDSGGALNYGNASAAFAARLQIVKLW